MGPTPEMSNQRVHPLAWAALAAGLVASGLALYGSFLSEKHLAGSPLNVARNDPGLESTREPGASRTWLQFAAYFLPFLLGVGAAVAGGEAMKRIERLPGSHYGNRHAVFAIMIGGLSAVVSGCMILAVYAWKYVPAAYTN
jgi:hypothetical protein